MCGSIEEGDENRRHAPPRLSASPKRQDKIWCRRVVQNSKELQVNAFIRLTPTSIRMDFVINWRAEQNISIISINFQVRLHVWSYNKHAETRRPLIILPLPVTHPQKPARPPACTHAALSWPAENPMYQVRIRWSWKARSDVKLTCHIFPISTGGLSLSEGCTARFAFLLPF